MEVHEAVRSKRAVRSFADRPLTAEHLTTIVNAGRRAQSSKNTQPWHFLVYQDRSNLDVLAKYGSYTNPIKEAAAAIAILTPDPTDRWSIMFDAGQAAGYMQLAAWELGVGSCPVTIHDYSAAHAALALPDDQHLRVVLALGYPHDPGVLDSPPRAGGRRPLADVVSFEHVGKV